MASPRLPLIGHSGCTLSLEKREGGYVVIKVSKDVSYNPRLEAQSRKQQELRLGAFRVPKVLESGYDNEGRFWFSMEYVHGFTLTEYLEKAEAAAVADIAEKFLALIPKKNVVDPGAPDVFKKKIDELENRVGKSEAVRKSLERLKTFDWRRIPRSDCHGDPTFENVIWKDGELYLVDFLDSFHESWMMDIGKLLFDVECRWSYRKQNRVSKNLHTRLAIFRDIVRESLLALQDGRRVLITAYHLALLHALRILPYTSDARTRKMLMQNLSKISSIIDTL